MGPPRCVLCQVRREGGCRGRGRRGGRVCEGSIFSFVNFLAILFIVTRDSQPQGG